MAGLQDQRTPKSAAHVQPVSTPPHQVKKSVTIPMYDIIDCSKCIRNLLQYPQREFPALLDLQNQPEQML
jgi:hypothetical protein